MKSSFASISSKEFIVEHGADCRPTIFPLFVKPNTLKGVAIYVYFDSWQFPWFQAYGIFALFGYTQTHGLKGIPQIYDPKTPCYFTNDLVENQIFFRSLYH